MKKLRLAALALALLLLCLLLTGCEKNARPVALYVIVLLLSGAGLAFGCLAAVRQREYKKRRAKRAAARRASQENRSGDGMQ